MNSDLSKLVVQIKIRYLGFEAKYINYVNVTSNISSEKNSSDPTTIKVTDKYLLENSWRITETTNMLPPLNRQQSSEYGNFCCGVCITMIF